MSTEQNKRKGVTQTMKLGVLFGGVSSEHSVSCLSAASVLRNLDKAKYDICAVGITEDGRWFYYPDYDEALIEDGRWEKQASLVPALLSPDRSAHGLVLLRDGGYETLRLDCVFPVLHGMGGEDGTVQGLLELAGIPYVGCGVAASANSMDKSITKVLVDVAGVRQARYFLALKDDFERNPEGVVRMAAEHLGAFPVFVKPCSQGSSVGVAKAKDMVELAEGLTAAFRLDEKVLIEEFIDGHEVECAVLGNHEPVASTVGEVAPTQEFYTFDAKYKDESSKLYIPAQITPQQLETVRRNALRVYRALDCRGLSRVDFFVTHETGEVVFNELNTIPGFTSISMYPKLFDYVGIGYAELLDRLIGFALEERHG
jgi:D-alanine-D-alanine ligase